MNATNVVVEQIATKQVNTKFGEKPVYSFKADGVWYAAGFKNPGVAVGDGVTFDYTPGRYGNDVVQGSLSKGVAATPSAPRPATAPVGRMGSFPIGPLDGQRSIVRQNALTNAREMIVGLYMARKEKAFIVPDNDAFVEAILQVAKKFEGYTAGDTDLAEVMAEKPAGS